jgi:ubiquinone/menaquinone biosynthesis C-methylase UbiE
MNNVPTYDSNVPKQYYNLFGEKEWTRLSRDAAGELLYHVHMDVFRCYVHQEASVLELGAGAGIFSKELVALAGQVVVSDISKEQLAINTNKMTNLGLVNRIRDFLILDITNLEGINNDQYDVVTCIGGALNYTFDKEQAAIHEMLRVTKPSGILIVGACSIVQFTHEIFVGDRRREATIWNRCHEVVDGTRHPRRRALSGRE